MAPYQYVVVRRMTSAGPLACQAVHAATEAICSLPVPDDTHVVMLQAEDGDDLVLLSERLREANIRFKLIREPDPPFNGAATALATEILRDRERARAIFADLKVLR